MARQAGPHYFIGRIGNLIYYKMRGEYFVKELSAPTREQIKKSKNYKKTRESNSEFAGAAVVSKVFRDSFASMLEPFVSQPLSGILTGIFKKMISKGTGKEGMRRFELLPYRDELVGYEFHKDYLFKKIFRAEMKWEVKRGRKELVLVIPKGIAAGMVSKPKAASHFRITIGAGIVSDHICTGRKKKYVPSNAVMNGKSYMVSSPYVDVSGFYEEMRLRLKFDAAVPEDCAIVALAEIQFFKKEGDTLYELASKQAMKIAGVF